MIQNVLFAISVLVLVSLFSFFSSRLTQLISIVPETPIFNYATNVWAPFLKAGLLTTTDCVPVKDKKKLYSLHNSGLDKHWIPAARDEL